jgi:hypothetical protein
VKKRDGVMRFIMPGGVENTRIDTRFMGVSPPLVQPAVTSTTAAGIYRPARENQHECSGVKRVCQRILCAMARRATLPVCCNQYEPTRHDCRSRINNVGSGADNVGRTPALESMIVGQAGCSIASRPLN